MRTFPAAALALFTLGAALSGCLSKPAPAPAGEWDALAMGPLVPVAERHLQPFNATGFFSHTLKAGPYAVALPGKSIDLAVTLPATDGADGVAGRATMNLGLFLPTIPGCDWTKPSLPARCHVPVIADAGPYYGSSKGNSDLQGHCQTIPRQGCALGEGDTVATQPAHRLGKFLIDNFVPYGYAVAQVSVFGTGDSTSCQDLMGHAEQAGLDAAVTWLGTQGWSNGNVSLIGRSYDGSTPWEAATFGNPHLKTIVPISGLTGVYELMWHNGSAELRGAGVLDALYAAMTVDGEPGDATQLLCPSYPGGFAQDAASVLTGGNNAEAGVNTYWTDRSFFDRALANYKGSVYVIHGLQDFNVDPHMSIPLIQQMQQHWQVKGMLGQWNHLYPDRPSEHVATPAGYGHEAYPLSVRYDWAQDLLEWFDWTLNNGTLAPDLHVESQDNMGAWHILSTWPPAHREMALPLGEARMTQSSTGVGGVLPPSVGPTTGLAFTYDPLANDTRIAGIARLDLAVTPTGPGGQVYALLTDQTGKHLGHAILDLRYASGSRGAQPVVPGAAMTVRLEFESMDLHLAAGDSLVLSLAGTGEDYLNSVVSTPLTVSVAGSTLHLPDTTADPGTYFVPPQPAGGSG
jgi:putative CocE/NonD family hydrolase